MTLEERAFDILEDHVSEAFKNPSDIVRAMLAFAAEERERAARVAENQRYVVQHPAASMDHEMEMHDDGCIAAATAIRNLGAEQ